MSTTGDPAAKPDGSSPEGGSEGCRAAAASILVVDDNATNLKLVRVLLRAKGHDVHTASDAAEALVVLETLRPRLILMDLQMPRMDGLVLTRRLKADPRLAGTRIVALTAYAMKGDEEKARAAGCDGYITKPIDVDTFPALLQRLLDEAPP